jgi:hypothetical protein
MFYHRGNTGRMEEYREHTEGTADPPNLPEGRLKSKTEHKIKREMAELPSPVGVSICDMAFRS